MTWSTCSKKFEKEIIPSTFSRKVATNKRLKLDYIELPLLFSHGHSGLQLWHDKPFSKIFTLKYSIIVLFLEFSNVFCCCLSAIKPLLSLS